MLTSIEKQPNLKLTCLKQLKKRTQPENSNFNFMNATKNSLSE